MGSPVYTDKSTPVRGHHVKVAFCSPQWQRKLESPLRVLLSCVNSHPDQPSPPHHFMENPDPHGA